MFSLNLNLSTQSIIFLTIHPFCYYYYFIYNNYQCLWFYMKKVPEIKNLKVCFLNFVSLAEFRKRKFIIYLEKAIHLLVKKMLPGNILLLLSLLFVLSFLTLLSIMDNIKKAASEMKYWVKSFLWYTPYRNGPSGTSVSKTKKEDLTMRKTVMIKNVMSMSQMLNQIESFIGKKNPVKK